MFSASARLREIGITIIHEDVGEHPHRIKIVGALPAVNLTAVLRLQYFLFIRRTCITVCNAAIDRGKAAVFRIVCDDLIFRGKGEFLEITEGLVEHRVVDHDPDKIRHVKSALCCHLNRRIDVHRQQGIGEPPVALGTQEDRGTQHT
jgi:hypothetical protein